MGEAEQVAGICMIKMAIFNQMFFLTFFHEVSLGGNL